MPMEPHAATQVQAATVPPNIMQSIMGDAAPVVAAVVGTMESTAAPPVGADAAMQTDATTHVPAAPPKAERRLQPAPQAFASRQQSAI